MYFCFPLTKTEVISELTTCKWLDQACKTVAGVLWQDLRQDFYVHILEKEPVRFECIQDPHKSLMYWSAKIMWNMVNPKTNGTSQKLYMSKFHKTYTIQRDIDVYDLITESDITESGKTILKPIHEDDLEYKMEVEKLLDLAETELGTMPFYERVIFGLSLMDKSAREIHRDTDIDRKEISRTIKRVKQELQTKWKQSPYYLQSLP